MFLRKCTAAAQLFLPDILLTSSTIAPSLPSGLNISFAYRSGVIKSAGVVQIWIKIKWMNEWSTYQKKSSFRFSLQDSWLLLYHRAADSDTWPTLIPGAAFRRGFQTRYSVFEIMKYLIGNLITSPSWQDSDWIVKSFILTNSVTRASLVIENDTLMIRLRLNI